MEHEFTGKFEPSAEFLEQTRKIRKQGPCVRLEYPPQPPEYISRVLESMVPRSHAPVVFEGPQRGGEWSVRWEANGRQIELKFTDPPGDVAE